MVSLERTQIVKSITIFILLSISLISSFAIQDTIEFARTYLFFYGKIKLKCFVFLYIIFSIGQSALYFIPIVFLSGWLKGTIRITLLIMIIINAVNTFDIIRQEPLFYLDPQKYYYKKINLYRI